MCLTYLCFNEYTEYVVPIVGAVMNDSSMTGLTGTLAKYSKLTSSTGLNVEQLLSSAKSVLDSDSLESSAQVYSYSYLLSSCT